MQRAFAAHSEFASAWHDAKTDVLGLRVPQAVGDFLILRALYESDGLAVTVTEEAAFTATQELDSTLAIDAAPEAGAAWAAMAVLRQLGFLRHDDEVVVFLTGSGELYRDVLSRHGVSAAGSR
jgi:threonine synthase